MSSPKAATDTKTIWQCAPFESLTPAELYEIMALRQRVFVVEQSCAYQDADGLDEKALHLMGWQVEAGKKTLVAYARLFPRRVKYAEASIGRVVTHPDVRGAGVGQELMREGMRWIEAAGWGREITIAAQMYLERFYESFGFRRVAEPYLEDDIWHVDMRRG